MKKILFVMSVAYALLFASCGQDENLDQTAASGRGELVATVKFEAAMTPRAAGSTAIPVTSWSNVKNMQLFLYDVDGKVAFSAILDNTVAAGAGNVKTYNWTNVPVGTYELAVVANVSSGTDDVNTSVTAGTTWEQFTQHNVKGRKINTDVLIDLKPTTLPAAYPATIKGYLPVSEVFVARQTGVTIQEGVKTDLSTTPLALNREVSLMRVRIDRRVKPSSAPALDKVNFAYASSFVAVQTLPVGLNLPLGSFAGGINATASEVNRVIIGGTGAGAFRNANPTTGYNPTLVIDGTEFTLWQDIQVLPNATKADGIAPSGDAAAARRYSIVLAGVVPKDYVFANGDVAASDNTPVYWSGVVQGVFTANVIREVNLVLTSPGLPVLPLEPEQLGGLQIIINEPLPWNSNIESELVEI